MIKGLFYSDKMGLATEDPRQCGENTHLKTSDLSVASKHRISRLSGNMAVVAAAGTRKTTQTMWVTE